MARIKSHQERGHEWMDEIFIRAFVAYLYPHIPEKTLTNGQSPTPLTPGQKRFRNPGKNTLSSIIGSYKSIVTRHARKIIPEFGWQKRFYDHIIRNDGSYARIRQYIINNPNNWKNDRFYD
jgi:hypothetical protein